MAGDGTTGEETAARYRQMVEDGSVVSVQAGELLIAFGYSEGTLEARELVADLLWEAGLRTEPPLAAARIDARSKVRIVLVDVDEARRTAHSGASQMNFEQADPERWYQQLRWRVAIAAVVLLLVLGWRAGTFDDALVHVGLNAKPCLRNAYGATFCGSSAKSYCESLPGEGYGVAMCEQAGDAPIVPPTAATTAAEEPAITTPSAEP
jgi:hypothetical protein